MKSHYFALQAYRNYDACMYMRVLYLNSRFRQVDPRSQVLAHEDVRIVSLCEGGLQFLQLVASERRAEPPLLPLLGLSAFSVTAVGFGGVGRLGFAAFLLELRVVIFHAVLPR